MMKIQDQSAWDSVSTKGAYCKCLNFVLVRFVQVGTSVGKQLHSYGKPLLPKVI